MAPKTFKRKKRKASEASTSGEPAVEEQAGEEPIRDVRARNELSRQFYAKERKKILATRDFKNSQYLDWAVLQEYGMQEAIEELIKDPAWLRLFAVREPAYKKLTLEFLTTLKREENEDLQPIFTFQAYGQVFSVQIKRIGVLLGLYDDAAQNARLPNSWPDNVDEYSYWAELIKPKTDDFVPSKSLSSTFARTEHKLLYHILSHTLSCKKTSHSKLALFDMFYLFSLITDYRIDVGVEVANFLWRQASDPRTKLVCSGGYITKLLKGMGIFQVPVGDEIFQSKGISSSPFRSWGVVRVPRQAPQQAVEEEEAIPASDIQPEFPHTDIPSTSAAPPPSSFTKTPSSSIQSTLERLDQRFTRYEEELKKEKKKNKKYRSTLFTMLKSAISCLNPQAAERMSYETSDESQSGSDSPAF